MSIGISHHTSNVFGLSLASGPGPWRGFAVLPAIVLVVVSAACGGGVGSNSNPIDTPTQTGGNRFPQVDKPTVLTYYYYWYDAATGSHLGPNKPLPTHPPANPFPSCPSVSWPSRQPSAMAPPAFDFPLPWTWA